MSDRHLECPGNAGPKSKRRKKRGGEAEVVLDEEGSDDAGETGNPVGHIDHERRQIGEPHLTAKGKDVAVDPLSETRKHRYGRRPWSLAAFDQCLQLRMHLVSRQASPISMPGQHPFEAVVEKLLDGVHQHLAFSRPAGSEHRASAASGSHQR